MLGAWNVRLSLLFGLLLCLSIGFVATVHGADDLDGEVEDESPTEELSTKSVPVEESPVEENTEVQTKIGPSPDVQTTFLFIQPANTKELPAGKVVKFLMGMQNRGDREFIIKHCETSFRYPQDFSYHIQNFTAVFYNRPLGAKQEGSFDYAFLASDQFSDRPLGLVVELVYQDSDEKIYRSTVFNETVTIVEDETNFNTETGFLYVLFTAVIILILIAGQHFLSKLTRKHGMAKSRQAQTIEVGTTNKNDVDFEWIPREVFNHNKSPKPGSPRQRKVGN